MPDPALFWRNIGDFGTFEGKVTEHCKWVLIGWEDSSANSNVDYRSPAQDVSKEKDISNWAREYSCDSLPLSQDTA